MPTEIKIVIPATFEDDVPVGDEHVTSRNYGQSDSDQSLGSNSADDAKTSIRKTQNERIHHSRATKKFQQRSHSRYSPNTSSGTLLQAARQQYFNGQFDQSHGMILRQQSPVRSIQKLSVARAAANGPIDNKTWVYIWSPNMTSPRMFSTGGESVYGPMSGPCRRAKFSVGWGPVVMCWMYPTQ
ncbi:hypothetical protein Btru_003703 [Bulinus truncatus]|nr:hypothetical protein Btru_003703 [Bulinus truncatus]